MSLTMCTFRSDVLKVVPTSMTNITTTGVFLRMGGGGVVRRMLTELGLS